MKIFSPIKFTITSALLFCLVLPQTSIAQNGYMNCGTDEMMRKAFSLNPQLKQDFLNEEARYEQIDQEAAAHQYKDQEKAITIYTIPIVFHIINEGGPENISDAQVIDAVRILNNDYRKLNSDTANIVNSFRTIASDVQIQFRLAQKDPNGNCTNGIDRVYSSLTNNADDNSKLNDWPRNQYLNVWTVKSMGTAGVAGYSYYPSMASAAADGVIILSTYIGSIGTGNTSTSRALTHEIGHYLNLQHTWGSNNNPGVACGNDGVNDTPITIGHTSCNLADAGCTPPIIENVQNYMEYSYCSNMFTAGQRTRMRAALTNTNTQTNGQRNNLWTTANLAATGISTASVLCQADFTTDNTTNNVMCQGESITFSDLAWNGNPTSWSWSFPGGTPSTSTDSTPTVVYNTPGLYNVSLSVSNASGTVSANKVGYIRVNPSTAMYHSTFYSEGFETTTVPNSDWQVNNLTPGGNTFVQTSTAAYTGTKSVMLSNNVAQSGNVDELISPSIDMTAISGTSPVLTFKVAYAQRTSTDFDKLSIYVSSNCGKTWNIRKAINGAALAVAPIQTSNFVPTSSEWLPVTVILGGYITENNLFIKFGFTSKGGNNIYIDDINISGAPAGIDELANNINFVIYPNPAEDNTTINFNLIHKERVILKINDLLGREVANIFTGDLGSGEHTFLIEDKSKLSAGVYVATLIAGEQKFSKKLIIK
ncbi:MAG: M43 family zinc metalloprotease [Bacteroidota bacterium]